MDSLHVLVYMTIVTWVTLLIASALRSRAWTPEGMRLAFGNRDDLPEPTPIAGRAERTARNTLENLVLFAALVLAAHAGGVAADRVDLGAQIFFWARLVFIPVYLAGIIYLRTVVWMVSLVGLAMIASVLL
jgi:uncharacterized MAPEG superfamily protein